MNELVLKPIKGKKKFDEFFKTARKFYLTDAAVFVTYRQQNEKDKRTLEYAVIVRKKNARKAVVRNRIKRLLRECLRQLAKDDGMSEKLAQFDKIMIVWANAPAHPMLIRLAQVCQTVRKLIDKASAGVNG